MLGYRHRWSRPTVNRIGGDVTDDESIRRVLAEFIQLRDDKRFAEWIELFAEDGTFEYGAHHLVGRSAIRENVEELLRNDRGKHLCVNSIIDVTGDSASVSSDFLKVNPSNDGSGAVGYTIGTMGRYEDVFVRRDGEWKIVSRKVHIMSQTEGT
jgi:3-phenylpropionate/cinnamic acid dioxygenase small subunit